MVLSPRIEELMKVPNIAKIVLWATDAESLMSDSHGIKERLDILREIGKTSAETSDHFAKFMVALDHDIKQAKETDQPQGMFRVGMKVWWEDQNKKMHKGTIVYLGTPFTDAVPDTSWGWLSFQERLEFCNVPKGTIPKMTDLCPTGVVVKVRRFAKVTVAEGKTEIAERLPHYYSPHKDGLGIVHDEKEKTNEGQSQ